MSETLSSAGDCCPDPLARTGRGRAPRAIRPETDPPGPASERSHPCLGGSQPPAAPDDAIPGPPDCQVCSNCGSPCGTSSTVSAYSR